MRWTLECVLAIISLLEKITNKYHKQTLFKRRIYNNIRLTASWKNSFTIFYSLKFLIGSLILNLYLQMIFPYIALEISRKN